MRYCSIHRLDYVAQCDACVASRDRKKRDEDKIADDDPIQLKKMLALRKRLDPDAPDMVAFSEKGQRCERCGASGAKWRLGSLMCPWCAAVSVVRSEDKTEILNTMVEAQRLADAVVDAAIDWHKSGTEESMDAAQTLEDAIEELLEFRRKMPVVKSR